MKLAEKIVFGVGAFTIGVAFYLVAKQAGFMTQLPEFEEARPGSIFAGIDAHCALTRHSGESQTYGHEWYSTQGTMFLPARYPAVSGSNVNAILHHGWTALTRPAVSDADWIERPPGEVQF